MKGVAAGGLHPLDRLGKKIAGAQDGVDVDLGLGREAGHRGAADVVDVFDKIADQRQNAGAFRQESRRP